ncbi:MAG: translation initiation factor IF-2 [Gammaproteobacteria bacterium]|nr:translation initiation factor IF-2 [Gammaproteobacteria bacterium]
MPTIAEYAPSLRMSPEQLLAMCQRAGLPKQDEQDTLSDDDKKQLVRYMRNGGPTGATLVQSRPSVGQVEIPRTGGPGRNRVKVKVKGKYRLVQPKAEVPEKAPEPVAEPVPEAPAETPPEVKQAEPEEKREKQEQQAKPEAKAEEGKKKPAASAAPRAGRKAKPRAKPREAREPRGKPGPGRERNRGQLHIDDQRRTRKPRAKKHARVVVDNKHQFTEPTAQIVREVALSGPMTVAELAMAMAVKASEVIKTLMDLGETATINDVLDPDTSELVVENMGHKVQRVRVEDVEAGLLLDCVPTGDPVTRPPVVTVMGHVDHGKTSLLDYLRKTRVAAGEAGGITQHIGAYQLETPRGKITFLDTPGHAAFTAMRGRGARCTDIIVLVVAADDGAKPQTEEAIQHARDAEVPMIVAINKIDRDNADIEKVRTGLAALGVQPEDWGGDTIFVPVSAKTGEGMDALLEAIALQAELLDLKAPAEGMARGVVIESSLDRGRGATVTVLVQEGNLRQRDLLLCGQEYGRVKSMFDDSGQKVDQAGPAFPVLVLGLSGVPQAGDPMHVVADEQKAREIVDHRKESVRHQQTDEPREAGLAWAAQLGEEQKAALNLIIKTDVRGSGEALRESLEKLSTDEAAIKIVLSGIGGINESDALLADASKSILLGFNVRADSAARRTITDRNLDLRYYNVIYELVDDVKLLLEKQLAPEIREEIMGLAEVLEVFRSSKMGPVAGCRVAEGMVQRGYPIRVLRDNVVIYEGELESLRRHKEDVGEVQVGTECGIAVANYNDVQVGDQIEVYRRVETARTL